MKALAIFSLLAAGLFAGQLGPAPRLAGSKAMRAGAANRVTVDGSRKIIPHVAEGAGWKTIFTLVNFSQVEAKFLMYFYDRSGNPVDLPLAEIGTWSGVQGSLSVGGSITFETEGTSQSLIEGWAELIKDPGQTGNTVMGGMAVFRQMVPGRPPYEAVVPMNSETEDHFLLPLDERSGFVTGIALVNTELDNV